MREESKPAPAEPGADPSAEPDWRRDEFWNPDWQPNQERDDAGFFGGLLFFLLSLTGAVSGAAGLLALIVVGLVWAASTVLVILAIVEPSRRGSNFESICAVTVVSWVLLLYLRSRRRAKPRKSSAEDERSG